MTDQVGPSCLDAGFAMPATIKTKDTSLADEHLPGCTDLDATLN